MYYNRLGIVIATVFSLTSFNTVTYAQQTEATDGQRVVMRAIDAVTLGDPNIFHGTRFDVVATLINSRGNKITFEASWLDLANFTLAESNEDRKFLDIGRAGEICWRFNADDDQYKLLTVDQAVRMRNLAELCSKWIIELPNQFDSFELVGEAVIEDVKCLHVVASKTDAKPRSYYFAKDTGLPHARNNPSHEGQIFVYSDWRALEGGGQTFHQILNRQGERSSTMTIASIAVQKDKTIAIPKRVQEMASK